jgi:hypothetical protein
MNWDFEYKKEKRDGIYILVRAVSQVCLDGLS